MDRHTPTQQILTAIESLQAIQKTNPQASKEWQQASKRLQPLFAEMARRTENEQHE